MTFILGTSQLTYDHFGDWDNLYDEVSSQGTNFVVGDTSDLGECSPGTFMPCETLVVARSEMEVP